MLSAPAMKKAEQAITKATEAITDLLKSREWEDMQQANALHTMLNKLQQVSIDFSRLESVIYGFELWKYLSDEAIEAERWKELEQAKKAEQELIRKQSTNRHYRAIGLEAPFPEADEQ